MSAVETSKEWERIAPPCEHLSQLAQWLTQNRIQLWLEDGEPGDLWAGCGRCGANWLLDSEE